MVERRLTDLSKSMTTPRTSIYFYSTAVGIAVIVFISLGYLGLPLWIDELHTSWTLSGDYGSIHERANAGNQSPLYFYILKFLVNITGHTESTLRIFSVVCACCSVAMLNWFCWKYKFRLFATLLTSLSFATGHIQLIFALEARSYSLLTLLVLILFCISADRWTTIGTTDKRQKNRSFWRREVLWLIVAALCFYTHYMAIPAIVSLMLAHLLIRPTSSTKRLKLVFVQACALTAILATQFDTLESIYIHRSQWGTFIRAQSATIQALMTKLPIVSLIMLPLVFLLVSRPKLGELKPLFRGALMMAVLPYLTAWATTRLDWINWFFPRYLVICLPAFSLFCGICVHAVDRHLHSTALTICLTFSSLAIFLTFDSKVIDSYRQGTITVKTEHWNAVVKRLNESAEPDDTILLAAGLVEDTRLPELAATLHTENITTAEYCCFPLFGMYPVTEQLTIEPVSEYRNSLKLAAKLRTTPKGWLIVRGYSHNKRVKQVLGRLFGEDGFIDHRLPGKVNLYSFQTLE